MGKQSGIFKIEGTLDGVTFYRSRDGRFLVKRKSGVNGERIKNDPEFARTRENGLEFANIASSGKTLRQALADMIYDVNDVTKVSRLTAVMAKVKNLDASSVRGERNVATGIATPEGKEALKFFNFNSDARMSAVLKSDYELDPVGMTISINGFTPERNLGAPEGATHVELSGGFLNLDFASGDSELVLTNVENLGIDNTESDVTLTFPSTPAGSGVNFYLLKVAFFQELNGTQYPLNNGAYNALQLIEVE